MIKPQSSNFRKTIFELFMSLLGFLWLAIEKLVEYVNVIMSNKKQVFFSMPVTLRHTDDKLRHTDDKNQVF